MASEPYVRSSVTRWPPHRWRSLDALRGAAIIAMAFYHLTWDLAYFRFVDAGVLHTPVFTLFGHSIACSFLAIAGFSLAIASRPQLERFQAKWIPVRVKKTRQIRNLELLQVSTKPAKALDHRKFIQRLTKIIAAALLVSVVTWFVFPDSFVSFGILHCIAAASLLSLAFVRLPWPAAALAGTAIFVAGVLIESPALDSVNGWLGLGEIIPLTNDWRPLFPWAGAMLAGLALGQYALPRGWFSGGTSWNGDNAPVRLLALAGRYSLSIYLIHQPLLFALVWLAAQTVLPQALAPVTPEVFLRACETRCVAARSDARVCTRACGCIAKSAMTAGLWNALTQETFSASQQQRYDEIIATCRNAASVVE